MKITIDTDKMMDKVKEGVQKYGKYTRIGAAAKGAKLIGKTLRNKMDREAIRKKAIQHRALINK